MNGSYLTGLFGGFAVITAILALLSPASAILLAVLAFAFLASAILQITIAVAEGTFDFKCMFTGLYHAATALFAAAFGAAVNEMAVLAFVFGAMQYADAVTDYQGSRAACS